jgi:hypothetical protein
MVLHDPSIYIKKKVCLFVCLFVCSSVRYAFSPCNSYRHQTFHDASLGPREGREGVGATMGGGGDRVGLGEISPRSSIYLDRRVFICSLCISSLG